MICYLPFLWLQLYFYIRFKQKTSVQLAEQHNQRSVALQSLQIWVWITVSLRELLCSADELSFLWRTLKIKSPCLDQQSYTLLLWIVRDLMSGLVRRVSIAIHGSGLRPVVSVPLLLPSFSCPVAQHALLSGWSWIMEIDYAATSQIPLPRAWPRCVWLQVGQACLKDALLPALEKGQSAGLPLQGHAAHYRGE